MGVARGAQGPCHLNFLKYEAIALKWERPEVFSDNVTSSNRDHLLGSLYCCFFLPSLYTAEGRILFICGADFRFGVFRSYRP